MRERLAESSDVSESSSALHRSSLSFAGRERTYNLFSPDAGASDGVMPLVVALHGAFGNGERFAKVTHFNDIARKKGFFVVYLDGLGRKWNDGRHLESQIDEQGFLRKLVEHLSQQYPIDKRRIYVTGFSNGGMMTLRLACESADVFAAFASVVATLPKNIAVNCNPSRPVSVLMINSDTDPHVAYGGGELSGGKLGGFGGGEIIAVQDSVDLFVARNGCADQPSIASLPDQDPSDGTHIKRFRFDQCENGTEVLLYKVIGGGHTWPDPRCKAGRRSSGRLSRDMDASDIIWRFFDRHSL